MRLSCINSCTFLVTTTTTLIVILFLTTIDQCNAKEKILKIDRTKYSSWTKHSNYVSTYENHEKGMGPLYNITNKVINIFVDQKQPIPDGYLIIGHNQVTFGPKVQNNEWGELLQKYWLILFVVTLSIVVAALLPIVGLCFCCCRCAGACGGRSQPFDKKHDTCRRFFWGLFLICCASAMVFGVVVAFVTNSYLQQGIENATTTARYGVDDTNKYLNNTSMEIRHLLVDNYGEMTTNLEKMLDETATIVVEKLEETSKAVSLTKLKTFAENLPTIQNNLIRMKEITNDLRVNASQLSDGLRGVKRELLVTLTKCPTTECKNVLKDYEIGKLDANGIDYNQLPDVTLIIDGVTDLSSSDLVDKLNEANNVLEVIKTEINESVRSRIPEVRKALRSAGDAMKNAANEMTITIDRVTQTANANTFKYFDTADDYLREYSIYRYYLGLAISSVLLLVLLCIFFGLTCGICGKRPDGYGDDCCNKGAGGKFLMLAVAVIFLLTSVIIIITLAHFLVGLVVRRAVCDPLKNPGDDQLFNYVDKFINLNEYLNPTNFNRNSRIGRNRELLNADNTPLTISQVIESCHANETIYNVLHLESYFNINDLKKYPSEFGINRTLNQLVESISIEKGVVILTNATIEKIKELSKSSLNNFDSDKFTDNLTENITQYDLGAIANKLKETANRLSVSTDMKEVKVSLLNQALHLSTYQINLVTPMLQQSQELLFLSKDLEKNLKFGEPSFEQAILKFLQEVRDAEEFIDKNGTDTAQQLARELAEEFTTEITDFLYLVINKTENEVGRCGPISNVYKAVYVATCKRVVDPFNGFWTGVAWCMCLFFPMLIFSVKLSTLYQKSDPYPGPHVESEYLYDAYSERDNIPLANGPKNKRRKKADRRRGSRDRRGDYYDESSSPSGPTHRDARYNDMAPKNWDGAPPRYQNPPPMAPPAEYERPPPYYFPGASGDNE